MTSSPVISEESGDYMKQSIGHDADWNEIEEIVRRSQSLAVAGQFAAAIMHEINNPLEAASNLNYLIQQDAKYEDRVLQYSLLLEEQLAALIHIARQTLSFYRSAETREAVAISTLAEAALRVHQKKIFAKQIRLHKNLSCDAVLEVHAGEMLQVISNLIANSIDALPEHGTLRLRVRKSEHELYILVADDGHGIPDAAFAKIFDPFFTTKKERGTGLGLAISKTIVERHRGTIRGRSSVRAGKSGTVFRVTLPLSSASEASCKQASHRVR
jgi:signal transduction histidine kinase